MVLAGIAVVVTAASFLAPTADEPGTATATPTVTESAGATDAPSASPGSTPSPTPPVTPNDAPGPSETTMALVTPCPGTPDCYVYPTRQGDTLGSVGILFGVTRTGILALNPGMAADVTLDTGTSLRIPPPTR